MKLQKCMHGKPVVQACSLGCWMGDLLRKNELLIAEVPSHEVAKMHAWKASSAGMRSWLLNGGFTPNCGSSMTWNCISAYMNTELELQNYISDNPHIQLPCLQFFCLWLEIFGGPLYLYRLGPKILSLGGSSFKSGPQSFKKSTPWGLSIQIWATNKNNAKWYK